MARVKVKGLRQVQTRIRKEITKELRRKETRELLGSNVVTAIKAKSLGKPAESTLKWRKRYDPLNKTDKTYSRNNINLTFTGELLGDLEKNTKVATTGKQIVYTFENSDKLHKKYQGVTKKIGSRSPYSLIAKGLNKLGYEYPFIDKKTIELLNKLIEENLRKALRKTFKV